jgi:type III pantothenate kinase
MQISAKRPLCGNGPENMKLLVDIGNTNTSMVVSEKGITRKRYFIKTLKKQIEAVSLKRLLGRYLGKIDEIIVVSVVPGFLRTFIKSVRSVTPGVPVRIVGKDIKVPIKVKYKSPAEVGQDRLVTSFAAFEIYGGPLVVIDFGTAVTFDVISGKGDYEGGLIFPGLRLSLKTLSMEAALLPRIELAPVRGFIGKDTRSSMNNGVLYGYASVCDGLIERFKKKYGSKTGVIATGGDAALIGRYSRNIDKVHDDIIFSGLSLLSSL